MSKDNKIDPKFRRGFIRGFTGKDIGINKTNTGQDQSKEAREARRKARLAEKSGK